MNNENNQNQPTVNNNQPTIVSSTPQNTVPVAGIPNQGVTQNTTETLTSGSPTVSTSASTPTAAMVNAPANEKVDANNTMSRAEMAGIEKKEDKGYGKSVEELQQESDARRQQKKEEFIKKANEEYKPNSKVKSFFLILFFILLIAFVVFLPDIHSFISTFSDKKTDSVKITNGKLVCELATNTENLNMTYSSSFSMTDNKLYSLRYSLATKGDRNLDAETLDKLNEDCKRLKEVTTEVDGIVVECNYDNTTMKQTQIFTYSDINLEKLDSAYAEVGGSYPGFEYNQNMDDIEKEMKANGYTCTREEN